MSVVCGMEKLWRDYLFLTSEMLKFTSAEDIELFEDLLQQRERLLQTIKSTPDKDDYIPSSRGQDVIREITKLDVDLREKVRTAQNMLKKNFAISSAYEGFAGEDIAVGNRFDSNKQ